jgi:hypothetical protein
MEGLSSRVEIRDDGSPLSSSLGEFAPAESAGLLDPEWEEAFHWSYGRRLWNIGCG